MIANFFFFFLFRICQREPRTHSARNNSHYKSTEGKNCTHQQQREAHAVTRGNPHFHFPGKKGEDLWRRGDEEDKKEGEYANSLNLGPNFPRSSRRERIARGTRHNHTIQSKKRRDWTCLGRE
jgi:hypothetical protein